MGPTGCLETSVRNHRYSLCNNPEERSSHVLRGKVYCEYLLQEYFSVSSVGLVTRLRAGSLRRFSPIPSGVISSPKYPDRLWGTVGFMLPVYTFFPQKKSGLDVKLVTNFYLVLTLKWRGAVPPFAPIPS
jgi:hypothetical protein